MSYQCQSPILLLVFNRPETTARVFERIAEVKPPRLYIGCDGARAHKPGEAETVAQVQEIVTAVDWPCQVETLFRTENLGCAKAVSGALDWFFQQEEMGIIIEDDCILSDDWFRMTDELLYRYRDDTRVFSISAQRSGIPTDSDPIDSSYFFSKYQHCWGWASWRRAWQHFDFEMKDWPRLRQQGWLQSFLFRRIYATGWERNFEATLTGKVNSWAYRWTYTHWTNHALSIIPRYNQVTNIGFGEDSTHTKGKLAPGTLPPVRQLPFPLKPPQTMTPLAFHETQVEQIVYRHTWPQQIKRIAYQSGLVRAARDAAKSILRRK